MKITCVFGPYLPVPPVRGGAVEKIFYDICKQFIAKGHDVTILSRTYASLPDNEAETGIKYIRVPSIDAPKSSVLYRLWDAIYSIQVLFLMPKSDITITHSVFLPLVISRKRAGRVYVSVGRFPKGQLKYYRKADRFQAVSSAVASEIYKQTPALTAKVKVVPNSISDMYATAIDRDRYPRERTILFVGRGAREKGLSIAVLAFIELAAKFPAWKLVIVAPFDHAAGGDGVDYLEELKRLADGYEERVIFNPPIYDDDKLIEIYSSAEIFIYPSIASSGESFGLAILEAMACGCAAIVSDLECFNEYVVSDVNALKFDHRCNAVSELSDQLLKLLSQAGLREQLGRAGKKTAANYRSEYVADQFLEDFKSLYCG